jgi:hypothetical protein
VSVPTAVGSSSPQGPKGNSDPTLGDAFRLRR